MSDLLARPCLKLDLGLFIIDGPISRFGASPNPIERAPLAWHPVRAEVNVALNLSVMNLLVPHPASYKKGQHVVNNQGAKSSNLKILTLKP